MKGNMHLKGPCSLQEWHTLLTHKHNANNGYSSNLFLFDYWNKHENQRPHHRESSQETLARLPRHILFPGLNM